MKKNPEQPSRGYLLLAVFIIGAIWLFVPRLMQTLFPLYAIAREGPATTNPDVSNLGAFGDVFGAINALFTGATLAFLFFSVWNQRYELKLLRQEQAENRKVMQQQEEHMKAQAFALRAQVDNAMFSTLLSVLTERRNLVLSRPLALDQTMNEGSDESQKAGAWALEQEVKGMAADLANENRLDYEIAQSAAFARTIIRYGDVLGPWFSVLHQILEWVDSDEGTRGRFLGILRAVHTEADFCLVARWALLDSGDTLAPQNLKTLIEKHALFSHWSKDSMLFAAPLRRRFDQAAFGEARKALAAAYGS